MPGLLDRRFLVVTGKGGVGKSTVAAALAMLAARDGRRVLVAEAEPGGGLAGMFETGPLAFKARPVATGVSALAVDTESSLDEYLRLNLRLPLLARIGPLASLFDFVATAAPGVRETLVIGKALYEVREQHYDLVILDAPATGNVIAHLSAPEAIGDLVRVGIVREQTGWMLDLLRDPAVTGAVVVTTPEELPVAETTQLLATLQAETSVDVAAIIVNRVLPELFTHDEEAVFDALCSWNPPDIDAPLSEMIGAARLAVDLRRTRARHLDDLLAVAGDTEMLFVPETFSRSTGIRATTQVADSIGEEL